MLTDRLTTLVDRGVLKRVPTERPDRFEYRFTRKGASLSPVRSSVAMADVIESKGGSLLREVSRPATGGTRSLASRLPGSRPLVELGPARLTL